MLSPLYPLVPLPAIVEMIPLQGHFYVDSKLVSSSLFFPLILRNFFIAEG